MKLLLIRHGEAIDDIEERFGGWADYDLSDKGKEQTQEALKEIKALNANFEKVIHSPLRRAASVATQIANNLQLPLEVEAFLREHNRYGIISGLTKSEAQDKYPEELEKLKTNSVTASEDWDEFHLRAKLVIEMLRQSESDLIAVTHGGQLRAFFRNYLNQELKTIGDLAWVLVEFSEEGVKVLETKRIEYV